jgi:hypothetical protein
VHLDVPVAAHLQGKLRVAGFVLRCLGFIQWLAAAR